LQRAAQLAQTSQTIEAASLLPEIHAQLGALSIPPSLYAPSSSSSSTSSGAPKPTPSLSSSLQHYQNALSLNPLHVSSLMGLAQIELLRHGGSESVVYGYLTAAIHADATCHEAWYLSFHTHSRCCWGLVVHSKYLLNRHELGMIHRRGNRHELAADHLLNELELERTVPSLPFALIPRLP
jgi:hypothetical protein